MVDDRELVAREAARLLYEREFEEYLHAKEAAADRLGVTQLPSNREVREELLRLSEGLEGEERVQRLAEMRRIAVSLMGDLERHRPRLVGSVATGYARRGSDVDLHLYTDDPAGLFQDLEALGQAFSVTAVPNPSDDPELLEFVHVRLEGEYPVEMTLYPSHRLASRPRCGLTGQAMVRLSRDEVVRLLE